MQTRIDSLAASINNKILNILFHSLKIVIMKEKNLVKGKKLDKRELKTITGGLLMCMEPITRECMEYGKACEEAKCKFEPLP